MTMFHLYGFFVGLGVVLGWTAAEKRAEKAKALLDGSLLWVVVGGVVGARLYHVMTDWELYRDASFFELMAVWNGGLGVFGAAVGVVIGLTAYLVYRRQFQKKQFLILTDLFAVGAPLAQAVGRWGNYVNGELYGKGTNLPIGMQIAGSEQRFHPLFLYESVALLCLWLFLWKKTAKSGNNNVLPIGSGKVAGVYLLGYGALRFTLEFLRINPSLSFGVPTAQIVSVICVICGAGFLLQVRPQSAKI